MIVYVNTKIDTPASVIEHLAEINGMGFAQGLAQQWFSAYNEFVYDTKTGDLFFFKKIYSGFWEANQSNLSKLK